MYPEDTMRSELVFGAITNVPNRYLLTKLASKAMRKLHRPNTRVQETVNDVFARFGRVSPLASVRFSGNLQPFPRVPRAKTHPLRAQLKQSVA